MRRGAVITQYFALLTKVIQRGSVCVPLVITSSLDLPRPPSFHPPSYWFAAVAPPQKNPSLNPIDTSSLFSYNIIFIFMYSVSFFHFMKISFS